MAAPGRIRALVLSDVRLYREGIALALDRRETISVVGTAGSVSEAIASVATLDPAVVVVDMATEDSLLAIRTLASAAPGAKIVAFAVDERATDIPSYAEAGLAAYVPCDATLDDLATTIELVNRDEARCSPRVTAALFRRIASLAAGVKPSTDLAVLSRREQEVLALIRSGLSNKEIAHRLTIEVTTVKNHVHSVLQKLQVGTRAEAASVHQREAARSRAAGF